MASSDVGQQIKCRVTATNAGGSGTAESAAVTPTNPSTGGGGGNPGGGGGNTTTNTTTNTTVVNNTILRARAIRRCKKRLKGKRGAARRRALKRYRKCVRRARKRFPAR